MGSFGLAFKIAAGHAPKIFFALQACGSLLYVCGLKVLNFSAARVESILDASVFIVIDGIALFTKIAPGLLAHVWWVQSRIYRNQIMIIAV
jgi:hypothetical protein